MVFPLRLPRSPARERTGFGRNVQSNTVEQPCAGADRPPLPQGRISKKLRAAIDAMVNGDCKSIREQEPCLPHAKIVDERAIDPARPTILLR